MTLLNREEAEEKLQQATPEVSVELAKVLRRLSSEAKINRGLVESALGSQIANEVFRGSRLAVTEAELSNRIQGQALEGGINMAELLKNSNLPTNTLLNDNTGNVDPSTLLANPNLEESQNYIRLYNHLHEISPNKAALHRTLRPLLANNYDAVPSRLELVQLSDNYTTIHKECFDQLVINPDILDDRYLSLLSDTDLDVYQDWHLKQKALTDTEALREAKYQSLNTVVSNLARIKYFDDLITEKDAKISSKQDQLTTLQSSKTSAIAAQNGITDPNVLNALQANVIVIDNRINNLVSEISTLETQRTTLENDRHTFVSGLTVVPSEQALEMLRQDVATIDAQIPELKSSADARRLEAKRILHNFKTSLEQNEKRWNELAEKVKGAPLDRLAYDGDPLKATLETNRSTLSRQYDRIQSMPVKKPGAKVPPSQLAREAIALHLFGSYRQFTPEEEGMIQDLLSQFITTSKPIDSQEQVKYAQKVNAESAQNRQAQQKIRSENPNSLTRISRGTRSFFGGIGKGLGVLNKLFKDAF